MSEPVLHSQFVLERDYAAAPSRVFAAWADPAQKRAWASCHEDDATVEHHLDFRTGGSERYRANLQGEVELVVDTAYLDIRSDELIAYAYVLRTNRAAMSTSMVTVEFRAGGQGGTHLVLTEQLAYLDGDENLEERREGTAEGLDRLGLLLSSPLHAV